MTLVTYEPKNYRLRLEGHARATQSGFDPVCAGASALAWTLVEAATNREDYGAHLFIDPDKAVIDVQCSPKRAAAADCRYLFQIILDGLTLIAEAHPDHLRIGGKDDGA